MSVFSSTNAGDCGFYHTLNESNMQGELRNPVGFEQYQEQVINILVQKDFIFNILSIGETGVGKSSFINTLFEKDILECGNQSMLNESVTLNTVTKVLRENNTTVRFNLTETVGYGDSLDRAVQDQELINFIKERYTNYVTEELKIRRRRNNVKDERVHVCFFFIPPSYQAIKSLDISFMKELATLVNVIPVISKSDVLSRGELVRFKSHVISTLKEHEIEFYRYPTEDRFSQQKNELSNDRMPFSIINANDTVTTDGKTVGVRSFPWGSVKVDDDNLTDFIALKDVIRLNMNDLITRTEKVHYERFRLDYIKSNGFEPIDRAYVGKARSNKYTTKESLNATYRVKLEELEAEHVKNKAALEVRYRNMMEEIRTTRAKENPPPLIVSINGAKESTEQKLDEKVSVNFSHPRSEKLE